MNAADVSVTTTDNDTARPHYRFFNRWAETSEAGASATFTVVLGTQPTANVTIGLSSSDTSEGRWLRRA